MDSRPSIDLWKFLWTQIVQYSHDFLSHANFELIHINFRQTNQKTLFLLNPDVLVNNPPLKLSMNSHMRSSDSKTPCLQLMCGRTVHLMDWRDLEWDVTLDLITPWIIAEAWNYRTKIHHFPIILLIWPNWMQSELRWVEFGLGKNISKWRFVCEF